MMMKKPPKVNIGLEIEINSHSGIKVDSGLWVLDSEHCGYELRSHPCKSPGQIKRLIKSIELMEKSTKKGAKDIFGNTGTHIHIDFLNDSNISPSDLERMQVPRADDGTWNNPLGTGKRYMWVSTSGELWKSPTDYMNSKGKPNRSPKKCYVERGRYVESVKRFFLIGIRFADVLFAMQHPTRRFNKYCHSIAGWDENHLMECITVRDICRSPRLLQGHRRHMFNPLSFQKFGTIEIRMIKGTLNHNEIWEQIFLFGKMAQLAKSDDYIPMSTGKGIVQDFLLLMGACKIHGKMRRRLEALFSKNSKPREIAWTARCFSCEGRYPCSGMYDYGLSRPYCSGCHSMYTKCAYCGYNMDRGSGYLLDSKFEDGRYLCTACNTMGVKKKIANAEKDGTLHIMGGKVGSSTDDAGPNTLRRMRAVFKQT